MKSWPVFLLTLFLVTELRAEDPCQSERTTFCPDQKSDLEKLSCLKEHKEKLSEECQKDLVRQEQLIKEKGDRGGLSSYGGVMGGLGLVPPNKNVLTVE